MTEALMAGIDLHSNNVMIGIVDQSGRRLKHQKLDCDLGQVDRFLQPFKAQLKSIAVESTYIAGRQVNRPVPGLMEAPDGGANRV